MLKKEKRKNKDAEQKKKYIGMIDWISYMISSL